MSALEDILSGAVGKALGADDDSDKGKMIQLLLPIVIGLVSSGGLGKILDGMKKQGLTAEADSWVGAGENLPITGDQAKAVIGEDEVKKIADQIGVDEGQAAGLIAEALPQVVDKVSPEGDAPEGDAVEKMLESISR
jgi:uncharacterized protein YidB (DUF937 family)